jgi:hypothetical protein
MSPSGRDWAPWAREHRAAFEATPLVELRGSEKLQIGFTLSLYAEFPMEVPAGPQREDARRRILQELRAFVEENLSPDPSVARTELEPPRPAVVLRPENELRPEVVLTLRIFHSDQYLKPVTSGDREGMARVERRLVEKGLKPGHW